jgi:hypothetical protein
LWNGGFCSIFLLRPDSGRLFSPAAPPSAEKRFFNKNHGKADQKQSENDAKHNAKAGAKTE